MTGPAPGMTVSAVIPTRNRPHDLVKAVQSILEQTRPPEELLIIDQSPGDESKALVQAMLADGVSRPALVYVHDTGITGLVDAKRVAAARASRDIVCFFEDDVVLEADYLAKIVVGFEARPDMWGCSGIITNPPSSSALYRGLHGLFFRGIFKDGRPAVYERAARMRSGLLPSHVLSGGLSAWRRPVFDRVAFDPRNGFFMFEDMEFATRVVRAFGPCLYVNPGARLEHNFSPVNRDVHGARQRRKTSEALVFFKKRHDWPGARSGLALAMCWWLGEALMQSVRLRTLGPVRGYFQGIAEGRRRTLVPEPSLPS